MDIQTESESYFYNSNNKNHYCICTIINNKLYQNSQEV